MMRCAVFIDKKTLEVRDVPSPADKELKGEQMLLKVKTAALNPVDCKIMPPTWPIVGRFVENHWGKDCAGIVEAVGPDQKDFKVGDEVMCLYNGVVQDYVVLASGSSAIHKPKDMDWFEAAGAGGVAPRTSYLALFAKTKRSRKPVEKGDRVLVIGGSGGCGQAGIQMAKAVGAHVTTICSGRNAEFCKKLGADVIVDYTKVSDWKDSSWLTADKENLEKFKFDIIYDTVSSVDSCDPDYYPEMKEYLKDKHEDNKEFVPFYVCINSRSYLDLFRAFLPAFCQRDRFDLFFLLGVSDEMNADLARWYKEKILKMHVSTIHDFTTAGIMEAKDAQMGRRAVGKVVIDVSGVRKQIALEKEKVLEDDSKLGG